MDKIDRIAVCKDSNPAKTTTAKPKATNKAVAPKQTASNKLGMHSKSEQQSKQQEIINNPGLTLITDLAPIQDNSSASSAQPPSTTPTLSLALAIHSRTWIYSMRRWACTFNMGRRP